MKRLFSFVALSALLAMIIAGCSKSPTEEPEGKPVKLLIFPQGMQLTQDDPHGELPIQSGNGGYTIYKSIPMFCTIHPAGGIPYTFDPAEVYQVSIVDDRIIIDWIGPGKNHCYTTFLIIDSRNQWKYIYILGEPSLGDMDGYSDTGNYIKENWVWDDPVFPKKK